LVFYKKVQTAITSENYAEKLYCWWLSNCSKKSVIYFLKAPVGMFFELQNKENKIETSSTQNRFGLLFLWEKKITVNGEFRFIKINSMAIPFLPLVSKC
jgi:hypothetical protein